jgi:RNA polymerase sigma-70 factor (ECF subfamily)
MHRTMEPCVESLSSIDDPKAAPLDVASVFAREADYVHTSLRRLGVHPNNLEDAVHDVFSAVHRHQGTYDPARSLRAWLYGFSVRVASNHRRTTRRRRETDPPPVEPADDRPSAETMLESNARRSLLLRALDTLKEERRDVLVLHDLDGIPMPELARSLALPLNTAYSRLRLAREDIAAAVRRLQAGGAS